jgi:hypothetical protein
MRVGSAVRTVVDGAQAITGITVTIRATTTTRTTRVGTVTGISRRPFTSDGSSRRLFLPPFRRLESTICCYALIGRATHRETGRLKVRLGDILSVASTFYDLLLTTLAPQSIAIC